jgi:hypothetical protein
VELSLVYGDGVKFGEEHKPLRSLISFRGQLLIVFVLAYAVRLAVFSLFPPDYVGWYWDSLHHWQIAYYTLNIGLSHGRLWDLFGFEYVWGILPTLVQSFLLWAFNTSSIVPFRMFNILLGSINSVLLVVVAKKYVRLDFILLGLLTAFNPILVFIDISGLEEPLAFFFLFLALIFYEKRPFLFGVLLGLSAMCRAEMWVLSWVFFAAYVIFRRSAEEFVAAAVGWIAIMSPYLWLLWIDTGDPIYPLRWNILGPIAGQWQQSITVLNPLLPLWRGFFISVLVLCGVGGAYLIKERARAHGHILYLTVLSWLAVEAFTLGVSRDLEAYTIVVFNFVPISFIDRRALFLLLAVSILALLIAHRFSAVSNRCKYCGRELNGAMRFCDRCGRSQNNVTQPSSGFRMSKASARSIQAILLVALVLTYSAVWCLEFWSYSYLSASRDEYDRDFAVADRIYDLYHGGTIVSDFVFTNYRLLNLGISPYNLVGSGYMPYTSETAAYSWLHTHNATIILYGLGSSGNLQSAFPDLADGQNHPPFSFLFTYEGILVYGINVGAVNTTQPSP